MLTNWRITKYSKLRPMSPTYDPYYSRSISDLQQRNRLEVNTVNTARSLRPSAHRPLLQTSEAGAINQTSQRTPTNKPWPSGKTSQSVTVIDRPMNRHRHISLIAFLPHRRFLSGQQKFWGYHSLCSTFVFSWMLLDVCSCMMYLSLCEGLC